jgi:chromosome segregation ATPase
MGNQLSLTILEIIVLMAGAVTLGVVVHFFITSNRSLKASMLEASGKPKKEMEAWKYKYFNDIEARDKEIELLKKRLAETEDNNEINSIEADEMRKLNKELKAEMERLRQSVSHKSGEKPDLVFQLRQAQKSLLEHNEKVNLLLGQIDIVKETEEKQYEILKNNEDLIARIEELSLQLSQKEKEIFNIKQKEQISTEMNSMIDSAYGEFNVLQDKIIKLESQLNASRRTTIEFEDMKESYFRITQDFEELKKKYHTANTENKQLLEELTETEDKLKEANFQRQQLQKKVAYLEELNNDMQLVADANKKLESQLKRIGELESMLNVVAEERDLLMQKK